MHNPVFKAFYMDHLDPEDRSVVRRWFIGMAAVHSVLALLLVGAVAIKINTPPSQADAIERKGATGMSQGTRLPGLSSAIAAEPAGVTRCALRDLQLVMSIEAHGEAQDVPGDKLADAYSMMMAAREACAAGRIEEALAAYDRIGFEAPVLSAGKTTEQGRP